MLKYLHGDNKIRDNFAVLGTCILVEVQKNWGTSEAGYGVYMRQIQDTCIYEADRTSRYIWGRSRYKWGRFRYKWGKSRYIDEADLDIN